MTSCRYLVVLLTMCLGMNAFILKAKAESNTASKSHRIDIWRVIGNWVRKSKKLNRNEPVKENDEDKDESEDCTALMRGYLKPWFKKNLCTEN